MTKEQKQQAKSLFEANPSFVKLWMNPKGEFFTNESLGKNSLDKEEKLEGIDRITDTDKQPTADEMIVSIKLNDSVKGLEMGLQFEVEGKNRKTVIKAFEDKIEELKVTQNNG